MNDLSNTKTQQYTVNISPILHHKLDQHIFLLKKLFKTGKTKRDWLTEAIEEKLAREEPKRVVDKEKRVGLRLDLMTNKKLEERVEMIRRFRYSYSKKQWIVDAIYEKLDSEEEPAKKRFNEYRMALSNTNNGG
jgi:hypothetical protein